MGLMGEKSYATWTTIQSGQFPIPDGHIGIKGIFVRGANLSKVLVEDSSSIHKSTIPARDIATQTDPEPIKETDFVPLNWRMSPGDTISLTPTSSSGATGHVYVLFARTLSDPEFHWENDLTDNTTTEPFDLVSVPSNKHNLMYVFIRGPDLENLKVQVGDTAVSTFPARNVAVNADPLPFSLIPLGIPVQPGAKLQCIAANHGTGGNTDSFFCFA